MKALALAALLLPIAAFAEEPAAAAPPKPVEWKGSVGAGLIVLTGNTDTTTFTGSASASRETFGWILSAKGAAAYGQSRPPTVPVRAVSTLNGSLVLRLDRKLGEVWSVYVLGGVEADHVASVELRSLGELGGAAQWLELQEGDWQRVALRTDLGFRYAYEARHQYFGAPGAPLPAVEEFSPRLGLAFRWGFSKEVFFTEEAEALASVTGPTRVQSKSVSKLSSRLHQGLTMGVGYTVAHDSRPAPGKAGTDTGLTALLELAF